MIELEQELVTLAQIAEGILSEPVAAIHRQSGGGNSRLYKIIAGGEAYALKRFPSIAGDLRDRFQVERRALLFLARHDIAVVPRWIGGVDPYGILSWIEGDLADEPSNRDIVAACDFLAQVHALRKAPDAQALPFAFQAIRSAREIFVQLDLRFGAFASIDDREVACRQFLEQRLWPIYQHFRLVLEAFYSSSGLDLAQAPAAGYSLISGDFGFHNIMRDRRRDLRFIDFEYFGWDDPVKAGADLLWHPAVPLSRAQQAIVREQLPYVYGADPEFAQRLRLFEPLIAIRWILIILNEFLPDRWHGRSFATQEDDWQLVKNRQLNKAEQLMKRLLAEYEFLDPLKLRGE